MLFLTGKDLYNAKKVHMICQENYCHSCMICFQFLIDSNSLLFYFDGMWQDLHCCQMNFIFFQWMNNVFDIIFLTFMYFIKHIILLQCIKYSIFSFSFVDLIIHNV